MDLRVRVMNAVESGTKICKAAKIFNVCRHTITNWKRISIERGSLEPLSNFQNGHSHGITDLSAFKDYVDLNPDLTQEEMGEHFGVGSSTISRTLIKINYTRKKRAKLIKKEMKNLEQHI